MSTIKLFFTITTIAIMTIMLFVIHSDGLEADSDVHIIFFKIKNIGYDANSNANRLGINITVNYPGHLTYMEEYYTVDSYNNPKFCCESRYFDGDLTENVSLYGTNYNASFDIFRPLPHKGKIYSLIKGVVFFNNIRIYEKWLTKNSTFIDNTDTGIGEDNNYNVNKSHEIIDKILTKNQPVTFIYNNSDPIYEINVTGLGDTSLRVEILKDAPGNTYLSKGIAYRYINILVDNHKINQFYIRYKIQNSWLGNLGIKSIGLFKWDNSAKIWSALPSKIISKDSTNTYLESEYSNISNDSLSPFAVIGFPKAQLQYNLVQISTENNNANISESPLETPRSVVVNPMKKTPGFNIILGIGTLLSIYLIKIRQRKI